MPKKKVQIHITKKRNQEFFLLLGEYYYIITVVWRSDCWRSHSGDKLNSLFENKNLDQNTIHMWKYCLSWWANRHKKISKWGYRVDFKQERTDLLYECGGGLPSTTHAMRRTIPPTHPSMSYTTQAFKVLIRKPMKQTNAQKHERPIHKRGKINPLLLYVNIHFPASFTSLWFLVNTLSD